ncbi:MAG: DUF1822 family protein [Rivularia sp. (in: cyanobacteria)]
MSNSHMLQFDDLREIYHEYLWVDFSEKEREIAWQLAVKDNYRNDAEVNRVFINRLCLNTFVKWLNDEPDLLEKFQIPELSEDSFRQCELVNGIDLNFNGSRLVLVPNEQSYPTEFRIPQEWVDIPNWAANYYLSVQLNVEEGWLRIWGFISHQQIRKKAQYDSMDRTYYVSNCNLIADIDIMWVAQELCPLEQPQVQTLPSLSEFQAKQIIEELSKATVYSPRLHIKFAEWAAILSSPKYRTILYNQRIKHLQVNFMENTQKVVHNLSTWFENVFEQGWRSVDDLFGLTDTRTFQFRSDSVLNEVCIKGAKLIDLGMQLESKSVALLIGLSPQVDNKVGIRVQLYPASGESYLPDNVQLTLLSESGNALQSVESRSYDNYIQLKRFKLPLGKYFSIQVVCKDIKIKEDFVLEGLAQKHE